MSFIIPLLILVPLAVGIAIFIAGPRAKSLVGIGVGASAFTLMLSLMLTWQVSTTAAPESKGTIAPRVEFVPKWLQVDLPITASGHTIEWQLQFGADGLGALLVLLTGIVGFATIVTAVYQIHERTEHYVALMLITTSMLMGVFLAMDLVSFYLFFEAVLLPLILLIQGWGLKSESLAASRKFLLYTLAGSIPMVIGLIGLALQSATPEHGSTVSLPQLSVIAAQAQNGAIAEASNSDALIRSMAENSPWILWLLLLGFGIKLAVLPLHTWLPTTYAAAHPNTTAMIAAVVAKLGVFGILRIVVPLTSLSLSLNAQYLFAGLGAFAIVYGAMVALAQTDLRRVLAYSSISHVGFITIGLMSLNNEGISGAAIQMFNHGLITASMFLILAMLEARRGPISLADEDRGLAAMYPKLGVLLVFFTLAGAGLPGLNGFVGELLAMTGILKIGGIFAGLAVLGTVLGAWYALRIVQRLLFGSDGVHHHGRAGELSGDLNVYEWAPLAVIAATCLYIGLRPQDSMQLFAKDVERIVAVTETGSKVLHPEIDQLPKE